jgi:hypothetical protein
MRNRRHAELAKAARALGRRYIETGNEDDAVRAIDILQRFAEVFPRWPVIEIRAFPRPAQFSINPDRPYNHWVHYKWRHTHNYDVPYDLTFAYDFVYNSPEWDRRPGTRESVENDLLRAGYTQAWTTHEDMGQAVNNLTGTLLASTILLGRTLGAPDMIHRAVFTLKEMLRVFYHFDGMEYEGALTYHGTVTGRCGIAERMLRGYSDPPGFRDTTYGIALDGLNLTREIPVFGRAWKIWQIMQLPNGNPVCVHDSGFPTERNSVSPDTDMPAITLNAYGHFALGRGRGLNGLQAHLHFCPFTRMSHYHDDKLSIILFGAGEELLSDIGYIHVGGKNRYFANSSISHNTVTVEYDEPPQRITLQKPDDTVVGTVERPKHAAAINRPSQDAQSTLIAYSSGNNCNAKVQLVAASVPGGQASRLTRRTRELLLVALDDQRSCLVDIYRIRGGVRHNFVLRPSADETVVNESCSLTLGNERRGTLAGENVDYGKVPPERERTVPYAWLVHKLRSARADHDWNLTWRGKDSGARLRVFMGGMRNAELWLGTSPSLRRAGNNSRLADDFQNPHLVLRHAESGSGTTFAAVYEAVPDGAEPAIRAVTFSSTDAEGADAPVAIDILTEDRHIAVQAQCTPVPGAAQIQTAYKVTALRDDTSQWTWTWGKYDDPEAIPLRLPLLDVLRTQDGAACDGFKVKGSIPPDALKKGDWIRIVYGDNRAYGYEVIDARAQEGDTVVEIAGEPGFELRNETMCLLYFPFYETPGPCVLEVPQCRFQTH